MPDLWLIGSGGHARSVIDVLEAQQHYRIAGMVDRPENVGKEVLGYPILASDQELAALVEPDRFFLITVGQIQAPELRVRLYEELRVAGGSLATVISPFARVSPYAEVEEGTVVLHHALVNAGAMVGCNSIINTQVVVEHDARVGDHSHIATGAIVNGGGQIGHRVFIGSHATVKQGVRIADDVVVGAHSYVHRDITQPGVYVGVPARRRGSGVE